jgi:hypothetical protein
MRDSTAMIRPLELELRTYHRERGRLESEHRGKFVLIRGDEIVGVFDDFHTASEQAARRFKRESYLVQRIAAELMHVPSALLDGLAAICTPARGAGQTLTAPARRDPAEAALN